MNENYYDILGVAQNATNKEIKKAIDIIDQMSMDEQEWELYNSRQMAIMDYNTGMLNARDEGEAIGLSKGEKIGLF